MGAGRFRRFRLWLQAGSAHLIRITCSLPLLCFVRAGEGAPSAVH